MVEKTVGFVHYAEKKLFLQIGLTFLKEVV